MQKTKKFRRLLAGGVAVLMLGVSVPVAAFATGDGTTVTASEAAATKEISFNFWEGSVNDGIPAGDSIDPVVGTISATLSGDMTVSDLMAKAGVSAPEGYTVTNGDTILYGVQDYVVVDVECAKSTEPVEPATKEISFNFWEGSVNDGIPAGDSIDPVVGTISATLSGDMTVSDLMAKAGVSAPEGYTVTNGDTILYGVQDYVVVDVECAKSTEPVEPATKEISFNFWEGSVNDGIPAGDSIDPVVGTISATLSGDMTVSDLMAKAGVSAPEGYTVTNGDTILYGVQDYVVVDVECAKVNEPSYPKYVTILYVDRETNEPIAPETVVPVDENGMFHYGIEIEGYETNAGDAFISEAVDGVYTVYITRKAEEPVTETEYSISFTYWEDEKSDTTALWVDGLDVVSATYKTGLVGDITVQELLDLANPAMPEGDWTVVNGSQNYPIESGITVDVILSKVEEPAPETVTMNIQFKDGDEVVAGGDYFVPAGVQNYAVLEQYVPEGYKMTPSGDFYAEEGGKLTVNVEKIVKTVIMNIAFKDGDEVIAGGDYFLPEGVQNYSILEQYLPEGYKLTVSGDFMVKEGDHLDVNIEKISTDVIMNIQFKDGDEVIAGGDYTVPAGVQNYSVLEKYVPAGYQMTVSGDFMAEAGAHLEVNIEKIDTTVIMNIQFKYGDEVIAGGDYFVPAGVQNYSVLEQYVPEGYEMTVSGDFMAEEGAELVVNLEKVSESDEIIMNVQFMDGDVVVAGGDYFVPAGVQNYSVLEKYVPAGYKMTVSGDFMAEEGAKLEVNVEKISTDVIMNIRFVTRDGEFVAGGDYFLPEGVQNYSILEDLVPEGYQMTVSGDFMVEAGTSLDVTIEKISTDVIMNIRFVTRDGTFVAGGDYFLPEGVQNLSILEDLVPTGYRMTETGDFMVEAGTSRDVTIELIPTEVIMNIQFWDNDSGEVVAGGDYFVPVDEDGIQNYSVLQQYVPEGYEMLTGGDFFVVEGGHLDVTVQKIQRDVIMNIRFVLADGTFIAGGDYFLPEGIQNMSILEQYVPAGYKMMESGDFFVTEGGQEDITVEKINETVTVSVAFKNEWGFVVGGGYYIVPAGEQDVSVLAQYVPAGYVLDEEGTINFVDGQHYDISVKSDESIVNIQFIDREGNVIAGGDYFVPTGVQNTAILDELGYTPVGYRQVVHTYVLFMYGHHYVILVEAIPEQVTAKTAVFRKDAAEDVWNENPDNPDEVRYTFYSDDAEATNTVPSITVADETKELDYWVAEMDSSITLQPGEEFCYNDLDQGALKDQIGDLLFIAVYKDVEVVEPTPAPSEEPTPAPSEEPTPAPSEEPTPAPSEEPTPAPSEQPTAEPTAAPTAQPETPADNNDDNTTTVTSDNSDDVVKSDTPADNTAKVLPQTGVESSAPVIGFAFVLLAALGGAAAYLFVVRKKLN